MCSSVNTMFPMFPVCSPHVCAVILVSCCQWLHVDAVLWSPRPAVSAVSGCTVFPSKEQYCPHSPVNWLITSLMRMEQLVTMGHIVRWSSDF